MVMLKKKPLDYYKALYTISSELGSAVTIEDQLTELAEITTKIVSAKGCSIMLITTDKKKLVRLADYGLSKSYIKKGLVQLDSGTMEVLQGRPVIVRDATNDPRVQYQEEARKEGIVSMITLPLVVKGEVAGILRVYEDDYTDFSPQDVWFLSSVANISATAIGKDQMYRMMEQRYQEMLDEKKQELEKVEEVRERLTKSISVVAHDLKSPLAAIQSYFSMILGGYVGEVNDTIKQMIERSSIRIEGLLDLIGDLLDMSRIEMGQMADEMEIISLADVVEALMHDVRRLAEEKKIQLIEEIPANLPYVYGSFNRLQQVFSNLLSNAVKFTPEQGVINLKLCKKDGTILGTVRDNGIGIPTEDMPYVFKDFYRASNVEKGTGTGLGLSIVKIIIEAHGGSVWVESPCVDTGNGTEFFIELPIALHAQQANKIDSRDKVSK